MELIDYDLTRPTLTPLAAGEVDMLAIYDIPEIRRDIKALGLETIAIGREPYAVLLSRNDPLASAELTSAALADHPVLEAAPFDITPWLSAIKNMLGANLQFKTVPLEGGKRERFDGGIAVVTEKMAQSLYRDDPDVIMKTHVDGKPLSLPIILVYDPGSENAALKAVVAALS